MVKQLNAPTEHEIYNLLGTKEIESWTQEKVCRWLEEKGWGHFASTFEKHHICRERFFQITLAELVQYLPRTMTTYYERRRLLNEIRLLVPCSNGAKPTPTTPTNISINTNLDHHTRLGVPSPVQQQRGVRDSGIEYYSTTSAGSSSSATSSSSPCSSTFKQHSPIKSAHSPKSALNKLKNTFTGGGRSSMQQQQIIASPQQQKRHESPAIPARISSTPDKISKFWANYHHWGGGHHKEKVHSPTSYSPIEQQHHHQQPVIISRKLTDQRIQITGDKETWYSLNVTNVRDPVAIKQHILQRMNYNVSEPDLYLYFHENGSDPDTPMDPQELMYLCSIADHSANQRILVKPVSVAQHQRQFQKGGGYFLYTPELGKSPTINTTPSIPSQQSNSNDNSPLGSPNFRPLLCRKTAARSSGGRPYMQKNSSSPSSVGIQLSDPPLVVVQEEPSPISADGSSSRQRTGSVPSIYAQPPPTSSANAATTQNWRRSEPDMDRLVQDVGLWAVAPKPPTPPPLPLKDNHFLKPVQEPKFWGERPPAEVVFKHMEQYFDSQDLDKEVVVVEPLTRKLTHTKSIRLVAREASKKLKKQPPSTNNMLRRKSTKLWGQKVVQVNNNKSRRLPSVSEHMRLSNYSTTPKEIESGAEEVQWIRGKLIGKGSFGRVYLAFNVDTGEVIAVKQVETPKTASDLLNPHQHDMVDSLYQEIMTLRDLDHENIVQYLGYGQDDIVGVINIFLEYVSGGSVASRLALHGALDEPLTSYFARQICSGLEYLHSKHILHRDIKAANILVEVDGICKISDFGLSKKNDYDEVYDQNSRMSLRGSIYWMAPEVVKNEPYSAKVDIWSLGCTVIEMLTGQRPWLSLNQIAALYNLGRLNSPTIPEDISDCAKDFLRQCFIIDPCRRPTAIELLTHPFLRTDPSFQFKDYVDKGKI